MLIGFSGKKGSGKSYFANYLVNNKLFIKLSFASPLKEITKILFNLSDEDVKDPIKKELINPKFNASPRELMQWLGTDIMREEFNKKFNYSGSIWIDSVKDKVKTLLDNNKDVVSKTLEKAYCALKSGTRVLSSSFEYDIARPNIFPFDALLSFNSVFSISIASDAS